MCCSITGGKEIISSPQIQSEGKWIFCYIRLTWICTRREEQRRLHCWPSFNAKLPQIHLPKFDGDLTKWQPFWDQYKAVIHDQDTLPTVSKFTYLTSLLSGEARNVVAGLSVTEANYGIACKLLTERYGRPERIIFSRIQALLSLQALNNSSTSSKQRTSELWQLQDTLLSHVRSLKSLGIKGDTYGMFLTLVVLSRLPQDIRLEWAREGEGNEANLTFLLEFLSKEIKRRERSEVFRDNSAHTTESRPLSEEKPAYNNRRRPAAAALHVSAPHSARPPARPTHSRRPQCAFCDEVWSCIRVKTVRKSFDANSRSDLMTYVLMTHL